MSSFVDRLRNCGVRGGLTVGDLALWFGIPYPTMHTWLHGRSEPDGRAGGWDTASFEGMLGALESYIKQNNGFPIPFGSGGRERSNYIRRIRDGNRRAQLSKGRVAIRGVQVRHHSASG